MITRRRHISSEFKRKVFIFYSTLRDITKNDLFFYLADVTPKLSCFYLLSHLLCTQLSMFVFHHYITRERLRVRRKGENKPEKIFTTKQFLCIKYIVKQIIGDKKIILYVIMDIRKLSLWYPYFSVFTICK